MCPVTIVIADDHPLSLDGIRRTLAQADDIQVVGEVRSGPGVLPLVRRKVPHVLLLDLRMPRLNVLQCLDRLRAQCPAVKVVIFSVSSEPDQIAQALNRGATAYIRKSINPRDLPSAIRQIIEGSVYLFLAAPADYRQAASAAGLTDRQLSVLQTATRGLSNQAISNELSITEQTVKFHLTNIYRKLGVANRTQATRVAYQRGLIETFPQLERPSHSSRPSPD
jgi:DNA-binding NarL/FixJ family response regulator